MQIIDINAEDFRETQTRLFEPKQSFISEHAFAINYATYVAEDEPLYDTDEVLDRASYQQWLDNDVEHADRYLFEA